MTFHVIPRTTRAHGLLNHPARATLRETINAHTGPWTSQDAHRLTALEDGPLRFEAQDGHLHVTIGPVA